MFLSLALLGAGLVSLKGTLAQDSAVVCEASYSWATNSLQQTPCTVAAYLVGACYGETWTVQVLPPGYYYSGPSLAQANVCECSSVVYNLYSACADCQNRTWETWGTWKTNCSTVSDGKYPHDIPQGTSVPGWSYLPVGVSGTYDPAAAQADISAPESTFVASSTASSTSTSSSFSFSSASPSPSSAPQSAAKKSNAGPIAGGVIGGLVVLALLIGGFIWWQRRQRNHVAPSAQYAAGAGGAGYGAGGMHSPPPMSQNGGYNGVYPNSPQTSTFKAYDPNDPSTFPTSPQPTMHTTQSAYPNSYNGPAPQQAGRYSGAPML